jgi:hypothetical protein
MSSAVRVGVQQRDINTAIGPRAGHDRAQHDFAASALAGQATPGFIGTPKAQIFPAEVELRKLG